MDDFVALYDTLPGIALHFIRAGAFVAVVPVFGSQTESKMYRLILAVSIGSIMWWTGGQSVSYPEHVLELGVIAIREVLIGLSLGFAASSMIFMLGIAGEVIAHEMGFSMSRIMNPETGTATTAMAQLFEIMGFMLIFQLDLHHELLQILRRTYEFVPVGEAFDFSVVYANLANLVARAIDFGLQYAIPIFGVMILLTVTLVVLARAVQNINLMEFSFGLRILLAFAASIYFLVEGEPFLRFVFDQLLIDVGDLVKGA